MIFSAATFEEPVKVYPVNFSIIAAKVSLPCPPCPNISIVGFFIELLVVGQ